MELDRKLQLKVLDFLRSAYPEPYDLQELSEFDTHPHFAGNLFYLEEHRLIKATAKRERQYGAPSYIQMAVITAQGLDFLEDDGGLTAILKMVTIRFDPEDIRSLLSDKIGGLNIPAKEKYSVLNGIRNLQVDLLQALCTKLMNLGLDSAPDVYRLIQTYLEKSL